jgi:hypothetical protein
MEAMMKTEIEQMSDHAIKRMVEHLYDELIAVGNMVRHTYGEKASKQLFDASAVLFDPHGELARRFGEIRLETRAHNA